MHVEPDSEETIVEEDRYYRDRASLGHNLSFAGCGFLGIYHVGVCACIKQFAPHLYRNKPISGTSAGALAAVCLLCDVNMVQCIYRVGRLVAGARNYLLGPLDPRYDLSQRLRSELNEILPSDAHLLCSGRLSISMTNYSSGENLTVNRFLSRDDLITAIVSSTFIPFVSGFVPIIFRGQPVMDGAPTNNLVRINPMTITVSPFAGDADICPLDVPWQSHNDDRINSLTLPYWWENVLGSFNFSNTNIRFSWANAKRIVNIIWPLNQQSLLDLFSQGYWDAVRYLAVRGFISCRLHRTPRTFSTIASRHFCSSRRLSSRRRRRLSSAIDFNVLSQQDESPYKPTSNKTRHSIDGSPLAGDATRLCATLVRSLQHDLGLNSSRCTMCRLELVKALTSTMPTLLRSSLDRLAWEQGMDGCFSRRICSSALRLGYNIAIKGPTMFFSLTRDLVSIPVLLQLDVVLHMVDVFLKLVQSTKCCRPSMDRLHSNLVRFRSHVRAQIPSRYLAKASPTVSNRPWLSAPPDPSFLPRLRTVVETGITNLIDKLVLNVELPNASECGLELFSIETAEHTLCSLDSEQWFHSQASLDSVPDIFLDNRFPAEESQILEVRNSMVEPVRFDLFND